MTGSGGGKAGEMRRLVEESRASALAEWIAGMPIEKAYTVIEALEKLLEAQSDKGYAMTYEVGLIPAYTAKLMSIGVLGVKYRSRRYTAVYAKNPETVRKGILLAKKRLGILREEGREEEQEEGGEEKPGENVRRLLMELVEGYDDLKRVLLYSFDATGVNILLVGPPASGKSLILELIGMLPGGKYITVSRQSTTGKGLLQVLVEYAGELRYLALDEFDKLPPRDAEFLLHAAGEARKITIEKARTTSDGVTLGEEVLDLSRVNIYIGANTLEHLQRSRVAALLDRFLVFRMDEYDPERTKRIIFKYLVVMEGLDEKLALMVAKGVVDDLGINRVRVGIQVGRLCKNHGEECVKTVLDTLRRRGQVL